MEIEVRARECVQKSRLWFEWFWPLDRGGPEKTPLVGSVRAAGRAPHNQTKEMDSWEDIDTSPEAEAAEIERQHRLEAEAEVQRRREEEEAAAAIAAGGSRKLTALERARSNLGRTGGGGGGGSGDRGGGSQGSAGATGTGAAAQDDAEAGGSKTDKKAKKKKKKKAFASDVAVSSKRVAQLGFAVDDDGASDQTLTGHSMREQRDRELQELYRRDKVDPTILEALGELLVLGGVMEWSCVCSLARE